MPHTQAQAKPDELAPETAVDHLSDRIAAFGGSWKFIGMSVATLVAWTLINTFVLAPRHRAFDPYPFVFLNLLLSMLAALQAPVIMMSQNRQADRDRRAAMQDFEVNTRTAVEFDGLRSRLDELRETQWKELVSLQREQMRILERLAKTVQSTGSGE